MRSRFGLIVGVVVVNTIIGIVQPIAYNKTELTVLILQYDSHPSKSGLSIRTTLNPAIVA